ncbi:hypothetical protein [Plebeiibacterium sediminum]|uniref:Potassium channel domain-containing protein n=1 Tax=Plebeiibacterium sediminum TaxID=2992112 RepID=A0AAE3M5P9_9BACT|nr:hypothetical protein [Plebeiobacterium sediminum]MCW3787120.1 hypothetical protein [Plebeiobacterium sediminum]
MTKIYLAILLFVALFYSSPLCSQNNYKRKISISEWVDEMENCKDVLYRLENTEIYFDEVKDSLSSFIKFQYLLSDTTLDQVKTIKPIILLKDCKLPDNSTCSVSNLVFNNNVTLYNCEGASQFRFINCTFKKGIDFRNLELNDIEFWNCKILHRVVVYEMRASVFLFSNCSFYADSTIIYSPFVNGDEKERSGFQYLFMIRQNERKLNNFYLDHCKISSSGVKPVLSIHGGKYDVIGFDNIDFSNGILDFNNCSVKENLLIERCKFTQPIGSNNFSFPNNNTSFNWAQIDSVGLGLYDGYKQSPFTHLSDTLVSDVYIFNALQSSYRKFFTMYKSQGDNESANACLIQMKDMETRKYKHLYTQNPGIQSWFNWRFNQFLKYFSKYGTSPVQSLIISLWTILIFAAVYFFFYSDWDGINRSFLIRQHRKLLEYFRSEQRLEDFYTVNYKEDFKTFEDYKNEMKVSYAEIPFFIVLLGRPLYLLSIIKHKIATFIYRRTELLQGRWSSLKPKRKVFVGITISIVIFVYLLYLTLVRVLNATTLSINVFSTLGFGAIPVKGISRYITIIEGFLGWFLLSIFSVSLISQMIQN